MITPGRVKVAIDAIGGCGLGTADTVSSAPEPSCCCVLKTAVLGSAMVWHDGLRARGPGCVCGAKASLGMDGA